MSGTNDETLKAGAAEAARSAFRSAACTLPMTAAANPSSQLRRQARTLRARAGTSAAASPCHIWIRTDVYSMSARSISEA